MVFKIDLDLLLCNAGQFRKNAEEFSFINNRGNRFDGFQCFVDFYNFLFP